MDNRGGGHARTVASVGLSRALGARLTSLIGGARLWCGKPNYMFSFRSFSSHKSYARLSPTRAMRVLLFRREHHEDDRATNGSIPIGLLTR
jgi:hypothetical protein